VLEDLLPHVVEPAPSKDRRAETEPRSQERRIQCRSAKRLRAVRPAVNRDVADSQIIRCLVHSLSLGGVERSLPDTTIRPETGAHFVHELIGMDVVTDGGEALGVIKEVLQPGANDVYVVEGPRGEQKVPERRR
jgi:ribosomal 30S subunit maturation factor RimM